MNIHIFVSYIHICLHTFFVKRHTVFCFTPTYFSRVAKRSIWPVYITCGNFTVDTMNKQTGSALTGCCPYVPYKSKELEVLLEEKGGMGARSQGKREIAVKHITRYFEQEFLNEMFTSIKDVQATGPIKLQVGVGTNARTELFYPELVVCVTDNEGGNQIMCIKSTKCKMPCRCCTFKAIDVCVAGKIDIPIIVFVCRKYVCVSLKNVCCVYM